MTSITIPESVTEIGVGAFSDCTGLKSIWNSRVTPQEITSSQFENVDKVTCKLYVPTNSKNAYAAATGWSEFTDIAEFDTSGVETVSGTDTMNISVNGTEILVSGIEEGSTVNVYDAKGSLVSSGTATAVSVPSHGVYVVKVGKVVRKVAL